MRGRLVVFFFGLRRCSVAGVKAGALACIVAMAARANNQQHATGHSQGTALWRRLAAGGRGGRA
jgi:hypothetical protein